MDTIFALASAHGRAGVAVIRISGPAAWEAVRALAGDVPPARRASVRTLSSVEGALDEALVLTFAKGASFTGEESAELHLHGSTATVGAVLQALGALPGLRAAEAGEFTRRALENGRLDLTQVEGLADLIEAETEAQRKQALRTLSGAIGARAERWRSQLIRAAALIEATIDFPDEDVPVDVSPEVRGLLQAVAVDLDAETRGYAASERVRDGFEVAIVGPPNAGKSTLLNYIAGRDAAITSEEAGTTRDIIEVRMDLGGLAVTFLDTAGLRRTDSRVEEIGVALAIERARAADLRVFLGQPDEQGLLAPLSDDIVLEPKVDLYPGSGVAGVSGKTGQGVPELLERVRELFIQRTARPATITRERHRRAVLRAAAGLAEASRTLDRAGTAPEITAEHLRSAIRALDSLVGRVDVEDLLEEIFRSFCIGK